jgi:tetratricopeptide (TPR) repeat protein
VSEPKAPAAVPIPSAAPQRMRGRRRLVVIVPLLAAAATAIIWSLESPSAPLLPPEINLESDEPEIRAAIVAARTKVVAEPESGNAWGELGMTLFVHGHHVEADACFAQAEILAPNDARWPYYRALYGLNHEPSQAAKAVDFLRRAASLPQISEAHSNSATLKLAEELFDRGEVEEAEGLFRQELGKSPRDPRAAYGLGLTALARGDAKASIGYFSITAQLPQFRKKALAQLAAAYRQIDDKAMADRQERAAAAMPPLVMNWPDAYVRDFQALGKGRAAAYAKLQTLEQQGRPAEAAQAAIAIVAVDPSVKGNMVAGVGCMVLNRLPEAESYFRQCLKIEPDNSEAHRRLAVVLFVQAEKNAQSGNQKIADEQFHDCIDHAGRCLAQKPYDFTCRFHLARSLQHLGRHAEAVKELRAAIAVKPDAGIAYLYLADSQIVLGTLPDAEKSAKTAGELLGAHDPKVKDLIDRISRGPETNR